MTGDRAGDRAGDQRGSATVLGVAFLVLLVTTAMVGASVAALLVGHRRAAVGADLAALAGAAALQQGLPGCARVTELAERNRVRVVRCGTRGDIVTVEVATHVTSALGSTWTVHARARAGPVR